MDGWEKCAIKSCSNRTYVPRYGIYCQDCSKQIRKIQKCVYCGKDEVVETVNRHGSRFVCPVCPSCLPRAYSDQYDEKKDLAKNLCFAEKQVNFLTEQVEILSSRSQKVEQIIESKLEDEERKSKKITDEVKYQKRKRRQAEDGFSAEKKRRRDMEEILQEEKERRIDAEMMVEEMRKELREARVIEARNRALEDAIAKLKNDLPDSVPSFIPLPTSTAQGRYFSEDPATTSNRGQTKREQTKREQSAYSLIEELARK